ncbi:MAG: hypothetical protein KQH79_00995 [Bacteroidetes bacterium]|nr:hypothetical protein [Bacteroidota bacterium]
MNAKKKKIEVIEFENGDILLGINRYGITPIDFFVKTKNPDTIIKLNTDLMKITYDYTEK